MNIKSIFTSVIEHKICKVNSPKRKEADDIIALPQLKSDVFEISQKAKDEILAQKVLDRTRKLGIKEFQTLTNAEISALDAISKEDIKKDAKINAEIGLELKNKLDKEFGKDKYVFVEMNGYPMTYKLVGDTHTYQFKNEKENIFKVTKLSNTSNPNVIFSISLIKNQQVRDLEKFKMEFI